MQLAAHCSGASPALGGTPAFSFLCRQFRKYLFSLFVSTFLKLKVDVYFHVFALVEKSVHNFDIIYLAFKLTSPQCKSIHFQIVLQLTHGSPLHLNSPFMSWPLHNIP